MAHVGLEITYVVQFTPDEFRLVGLALSGKLKGEDLTTARGLNVRLMELRLGQLGQLQQVSDGALAKAKEASVPPVGHQQGAG